MTGKGLDCTTLCLPFTVTSGQPISPTTLGGWGWRLRHKTDITAGLRWEWKMIFYYVTVLAKCEYYNFRKKSNLSPTCELSNFTSSSKIPKMHVKTRKETKRMNLHKSCSGHQAQDAWTRVCTEAQTPPLARVRDPGICQKCLFIEWVSERIKLRLKRERNELEILLEIPRIEGKDSSLGFMFARLHHWKWFVFVNIGHIASLYSGNLWYLQSNSTELLLCLPQHQKSSPGPNGRQIYNISYGFLNDFPPTTTFFSIYSIVISVHWT